MLKMSTLLSCLSLRNLSPCPSLSINEWLAKGQIPAVVVSPAFFPVTHTAEQKMFFDQSLLNKSKSRASVLFVDTY